MSSGAKLDAGAEEGVHGALGVGRHQDQAAGGRGDVAQGLSNCTPMARMSWRNTWPSWSSLTLPI